MTSEGNADAPEVRSTRWIWATAGALLTACGAVVAYGALGDDTPHNRPVPTAAVTYEITGEGTANVSYLGRSTQGTETVEKAVALPWKRSVRVPLGQEPTVRIQLDERGGEASCALAVRGEHIQRASALGSHGRATCAAAQLPGGDR